MDLRVMSLEELRSFTPIVPTYGIRLNGTGRLHWDYSKYKPNDSGPLWVAVREYAFDDVDDHPFGGTRQGEGKSIDGELADKIVSDFVPYWNLVDSLVVYSICGRSRPTGVLLGLNDAFGLGGDESEIKRKHEVLIGQKNSRCHRMIAQSGRKLFIRSS